MRGGGGERCTGRLVFGLRVGGIGSVGGGRGWRVWGGAWRLRRMEREDRDLRGELGQLGWKEKSLDVGFDAKTRVNFG